MKMLLTGATGYIGRAIAAQAVAQGVQLVALVRAKPNPPLPCPFLIPSDWRDPLLLSKAMEGCDAVIHAAGLAHGKAGNMEEVNLRLTRTLAEAVIKARVKRFVFLSSASVFGHKGVHRVTDFVSPSSPYGHSKAEAERVLAALCQNTSTTCSIIRPPMVLGPNAPGRAATLRRWSQFPLPFAALPAKRSYMMLDDLVEAVLKETSGQGLSALIHPEAPIATATGMIRHIAAQDGLKLRLFPFPEFLLKLGALFLGSKKEALRPLLETHIMEPGRAGLDRLV